MHTAPLASSPAAAGRQHRRRLGHDPQLCVKHPGRSIPLKLCHRAPKHAGLALPLGPPPSRGVCSVAGSAPPQRCPLGGARAGLIGVGALGHALRPELAQQRDAHRQRHVRAQEVRLGPHVGHHLAPARAAARYARSLPCFCPLIDVCPPDSLAQNRPCAPAGRHGCGLGANSASGRRLPARCDTSMDSGKCPACGAGCSDTHSQRPLLTSSRWAA